MSQTKSITHVVSPTGVISAFVNNRAYTIAPNHIGYKQCLKAVNTSDVALFLANCEVKGAVASAVGNYDQVRIDSGRIFYKNTEIHGDIVNRILSQLEQGAKVKNLVAFLNRLMKNPSSRAVKELYGFLANKGMPITDDGYFLAYKSVRKDADGKLWDWYSGTVENTIGVPIPPMERNMVDDNWGNACSEGYHVGNLVYASGFNQNQNQVLLIVKVDPANVVSVPDYHVDKCRVTVYEAVGIYDGPLPDLIAPAQYQPTNDYADVNTSGGLSQDKDHWSSDPLNDDFDNSDDDEICNRDW